MSNRKNGRPNIVEVNIKPDEYEYLKLIAERLFHNNVSELCRVITFNENIYDITDEEIINLNYEINKIKNNIEQISKLSEGTHNYHKVSSKLKDIIAKIEIINRMIYKNKNYRNKRSL